MVHQVARLRLIAGLMMEAEQVALAAALQV